MKKQQSRSKNSVEKIVDGLVKTIEQAKGFALEQAPDVAKQIVEERKVELKFDAASGLIGLALSLIAITACYFYPDSREGAVVARVVISLMSAILLGCPSAIQAWISFEHLTRLKVAPKYYLLKKLKDLVE